MRAGIIAKKIGMSNLFTSSGVNIPVTVLKVDECKVIERHEVNNSDSDKVTLGASEVKKINKSKKGYFDKKKSKPYKLIKEFFVEKSDELKSGDDITVDHFKEGQFIDISGISKGKGFSGVMKRHNFSGLRASHGVSVSHRSHGSTGQNQDPGKVFKGKKMAGHMGDKFRTIQNLEIIKSDMENNLMYVKGSIPGSINSIILIQKNKKKINRITTLEKSKKILSESSQDDKKAKGSKSSSKPVPSGKTESQPKPKTDNKEVKKK